MQQTQAFSQTGTVAQILSGLRQLQSYDDYVEEQSRQCRNAATKWWLGCGGSLVVLIVSIVLTGIAVIFVGLLVLAAVAMIVCLVFGIMWSARSSKWGRQDLDDRRLALAAHFFQVIGQDVPPKAQCSLSVNFDGYLKHGTRVQDQKVQGQYPSRLMKYEDFWLSVSGKLLDGNRFRVAVEQIVRRKEKRKPKYTKVLERISDKITLVLRIAPESYPNWQHLAQTLQPGATTEGFQVTRAQVQDGVLRVVAVTPMYVCRSGRGTSVSGTENQINGDTLLGMFLYAYDKLGHCRPQAGQGGPAISPEGAPGAGTC